MTDELASAVARELRLLRQTLLGVGCGVAIALVSFQVSNSVTQSSASNSQLLNGRQLQGIQGELRQLREDLARHRSNTQPTSGRMPGLSRQEILDALKKMEASKKEEDKREKPDKAGK